MAALTLRAPAKLNLYLHILGKRADGYHTMESLVAFTKLADELMLEPSAALSLEVRGEFAAEAGDNHNNLVLKAAQLLASQSSTAQGARLTLTKNIPVGGGLGGGSADAAAALRGLNRLWGLNLSDHDLRALAVTLGADVAMCIDSVPAIARGIGEALTPLPQPLPLVGVVLVHPRTPLLTKDVYEALSITAGMVGWQAALDSASAFLASLASTRNHLQPAAISLSAAVTEILLALETMMPAPALVRMTGSGACCFALYSNPIMADEAAARLGKEYPQWWIRATRLVPPI